MFLAHKFTSWVEFSKVGSSQSHEASAAQPVWGICFQDGSLTWLSSWWGYQLGVHLGLLARGHSLGLIGLPHSMTAEFQKQALKEAQMEAARVLINQPKKSQNIPLQHSMIKQIPKASPDLRGEMPSFSRRRSKIICTHC